MKQYKLELLIIREKNGVKTTRTSFVDWFDDPVYMQSHITFMRGLPLDDGEVKFRITTYGPVKVEEV